MHASTPIIGVGRRRESTALTAVAEAESYLRALGAEVAAVRPGECLYCYVIRMLDAFGCDNNLRWAARFRDLTAPRATALDDRLARMGGYCDCEIFLNGVTLRRGSGDADEGDDDDLDPSLVPPCAGVRRGSTRGCANWRRRVRWGRW
jgi:hypothetical protein